jgi:hypothetical protein
VRAVSERGEGNEKGRGKERKKGREKKRVRKKIKYIQWTRKTVILTRPLYFMISENEHFKFDGAKSTFRKDIPLLLLAFLSPWAKCHKTFQALQFTSLHNQLEYLSQTGLSSLVQCW